MYGSDLRPLSLGEVLDRTFSLYRRRFPLWLGLAAVPLSATLLFSALQALLLPNPFAPGGTALNSPLAVVAWGVSGLFAYVLSVTAYSVALGGLVVAASQAYLGREAGILSSLRKVFSEFWSLMGVGLLTGAALLVGTLMLIVPGIYLTCRLLITFPVTLIESRGPGASFSRSLDLTAENAGRSFVILVLYSVVTYGLMMTAFVVVGVAMATRGQDPSLIRLLGFLVEVCTFVINCFCAPILAIACTVFYYDLRVRKEGFDLQILMDPASERSTPTDRGLSLLP